MAATPYQILTFIGRGTGARDYQRLKAALERLKTTTVATSLPRRTSGASTASAGSTKGLNVLTRTVTPTVSI
jgi:plasmid replication initiation protein